MDIWPQMTLAGGPVQMTERTLRDQSRPVLDHYDPAFIEFFIHTTELLQKVFHTHYDVIILQTKAILGLETAAAGLISPGNQVFDLVSGVFVKWFELFIYKHGGETIELAVSYNDSIDPEDVRRKLKGEPGIKFLSVVHSETPSVTINPMREIRAIAREHGVLTIVDTVSGLGEELMSPENWGMDVAIAGPQKCLGGPPGLSLLSGRPSA
jgi:pyridoxamine--pyruvate transaminase